MSYFSPRYLYILLPLTVLFYNVVPNKIRRYFLLFFNLAFYFWVSKNLLICLLLSIISVYTSGLLMNKIDNEKEELLKKYDDKKIVNQKIKNKKRIILVLCILFNFSFLFFFKYLNFFKQNMNIIFDLFNINQKFNISKIVSPMGISFYTLMALSYLFDVYNKKIIAEKSFVKVALYLSFFTQMLEGPISRFSDTSESLYNAKKTTYKGICLGFQRILYGLFKKEIIANRINVLVDLVFSNYSQYNGATVLLGAISYTILLYMEFSGTMDVILGTGELFGVKIPENFRQPFFAKTVSEFWTRWHISLGAWFRDYIYYPLSLSKPLKKITLSSRKIIGNHYGPLISGSIALLVVWLLNGLWHGAGYTFLFFGIYHFVLIAGGNFINPLVIYICDKLHINRNNNIYRVMQSIKMSIFVVFGELIFRANTLTDTFNMIGKIFTSFKIKNPDLLNLGLDIYDYIIVFVGVLVVFIISLIKEKGINVNERLFSQKTLVRWAIIYVLILFILIFGAYGPGYIPVDPIYADF